MRKRRRIATLLLFPILAIVFMVGWLLSTVGDSQTGTKLPQRKNVATKNHNDINKEESLGMGLMEQLSEEQITTE